MKYRYAKLCFLYGGGTRSLLLLVSMTVGCVAYLAALKTGLYTFLREVRTASRALVSWKSRRLFLYDKK